MFQFEDVVGMVKRLFNESEPHWADAWEHEYILTLAAESFRDRLTTAQHQR